MADTRVQDQYEAFPYPVRDPRDEAKGLRVSSPSSLFQLNHFVFGGRLDLSQPLRVLIAGGGTGDAAIMLGQQMADHGVPGTVLHLDLSAASQDVARARAETRNLENIEFVQGSLLDVSRMDLGPFDYIDCCGVLHHLDDPAAGLRALVSVLAPGGGLGIMVYGELGRTGVYHLQDMLRTVTSEDEDANARIALAKRMIKDLPTTNWFRRNGQMRDHEEYGDAGLFDLLLHSKDRAYRVPEIAELAAIADLKITGFIAPADYDPARYIKSPALIKRLDDLDWLQRASLAELITGNLKKHTFYAVRRDNPVEPPQPDHPDLIPLLHDVTPEDAAQHMPVGGTITRERGGLQLPFQVPPLARAIAERCDGKRNLRQIHSEIRDMRSDLTWDAFLQQFTAFYATMHAINRLYLRWPASGEQTE